jgi:hypothetical protein
MKHIIVLAFALVSSVAFARTDTTTLTCRDAAGLVDQAGAIVLSTGKPYLYDRFVAHAGYCGAGEKAAAAYVKTLDNSRCKIGYSCVSAGSDDQPAAKTYPSSIRACKEGRTQVFHETDPNNSDRNVAVTYVCRAGKYVPLYGKARPAPVIRRCTEGRRQAFHETDPNNSDRQIVVVKVCRNGRYVD